MEERQISHAEQFQTIDVYTSLPKRGQLNSPCFKCGLCTVTLFIKFSMGTEKKE